MALNVKADDNIRVILDGDTVIDSWKAPQKNQTYHTPILESGIYPIELQYEENVGPASVFLGWKHKDDEEIKPIPPKYLLPRKLNMGGGGINSDCPEMPRVRPYKKAPSK